MLASPPAYAAAAGVYRTRTSISERPDEAADTVGFNVGADVAYYFTGNFGVGWLTRYSRAMVEVPSASGETLDIEVGGLHTAVGLRVRF